MRCSCLVGKKKKKKKKKKMDRIGAASWPASDLGSPAPTFFGAFNHLPSQHSRIVVRPEAIAENSGPRRRFLEKVLNGGASPRRCNQPTVDICRTGQVKGKHPQGRSTSTSFSIYIPEHLLRLGVWWKTGCQSPRPYAMEVAGGTPLLPVRRRRMASPRHQKQNKTNPQESGVKRLSTLPSTYLGDDMERLENEKIGALSDFFPS